MDSFKVYRPVKSDHLWQGFDENIACAKTDQSGSVIKPYKIVSGTQTTCPVNSVKFYPLMGLKGHNGWDSQIYHGEPIYFPVVTKDPIRWNIINEIDASGGVGVNVYALDPVPFDTIPTHAQGSFKMIEDQYQRLGGKLFPMFKFWHLKSSAVTNHQEVTTGALLGYGDNTGASSGDHLHWSMKIHGGTTHGFGMALDSDNGYSGAFDFIPFYENEFILDVQKPVFQFSKDLKMGVYNEDVGVLQAFLVRHGYMQPIKEDEVGYYGKKTRAAVFAFQVDKNMPLSSYEKLVLRGSVVGPKTRAVLNTLINT